MLSFQCQVCQLTQASTVYYITFLVCVLEFKYYFQDDENAIADVLKTQKHLPVGRFQLERDGLECLLELVWSGVLERDPNLRGVFLTGRGHDTSVSQGLQTNMCYRNWASCHKAFYKWTTQSVHHALFQYMEIRPEPSNSSTHFVPSWPHLLAWKWSSLAWKFTPKCQLESAIVLLVKFMWWLA